MMGNQARINGDPVPQFIFSHQIQRRLRKHPIQFYTTPLYRLHVRRH
jgi:hypothetical protein